MGFIGKVFKGIGKGLGAVAKGVVKFAKSPLGKVLFNVGLSFLTGGAGGLLSGALGGLSKLGGLGKIVSGFADKFLGNATSLLSKGGLSSVAGLISQSSNSRQLLGIVTDVMGARNGKTQPDPVTVEAANQNLRRLAAFQQAQLLNAA